jgi:hypothetical protein
MATGGAGRASQVGVEGALLNPANFPLTSDYYFGGIFAERELDSAGFVTEWGLIILDKNPEALFPAMFVYSQKDKRLGDLKITEVNYEVSSGKPVTEWLAIGASVRYLEQKSNEEDDEKIFNGSLGALIAPLPGLSFAVVLQNLRSKHTIDMEPSIELGASYKFEEMVLVSLDSVFYRRDNPDQKGVYLLGLESYLPYDLRLGLGYRKNDFTGEAFQTIGAGWNGPKVDLSYSYERNALQEGRFAHSFDLLVYF